MKETPDFSHTFDPDSNGNGPDPMVDTDFYGLPVKDKKKAHKGPKWYEMINYSPEFLEELPKLRYIRGPKARFTITTFEQIDIACRTIFECNKEFFRFRSQVDMIAHYLGTKILEEIYMKRRGLKKSTLSSLLENKEKTYLTWDNMKCIKGVFGDLMEKYVEGFIDNRELDVEIEELVTSFEGKDEQKKMRQIIENMKLDGEAYKAKDRVRKTAEYKKKAEAKGIREVK